MADVSSFAVPPLTPGDRVPDLLLGDQTETLISLYDHARGKPIVVLMCPPGSGAELREQLVALEAGFYARGGELAHCFVIIPAANAPASASTAQFTGHVLCERDNAAANALRTPWGSLGGRPKAFVLDPNQRLLAVFDANDSSPIEAARRFVSGLALFSESMSPCDLAPALLIPRVFEPDFCARLIEVFHARGHEESGVYSMVEGELVHGVDHAMKKRYDHYVRDEDLMTAIKERFAARVVPEIHKAFCYPVTKLEEFKITCYRASEQGYFRPHRDNYSPQTVHRRFALTLNLNADFEGGQLRFPEYGLHLYRPRLGEAVVFSCALLHEALGVTRGDRYVLVAFLYGEDGARQRRAMQARMAGQ